MKKFKLLFLAMLMSFNAAAFAEGLKIGVVDYRTIMATSPKAKEVGEALKNEFKPREEEIMKAEKNLKEKGEKLQRNAAIMSDIEKTKLERELQAGQRDLQRLQYEYREDFSLRNREEMQKFMEKIQVVIEAIAKEQKYDLVIQSEAMSFVAKNIDITDLVLKKMANG